MLDTALTTKEKADLADMACKRLYLDTLEEQKSDSLDFHEVAVWQIEDLIQRAYVMGLQAAGQWAGPKQYKPTHSVLCSSFKSSTTLVPRGKTARTPPVTVWLLSSYWPVSLRAGLTTPTGSSPWPEPTPDQTRSSVLLYSTMNSYDITDQVLSQLDYYVARISYLRSVGDSKSADILEDSARLMAAYADSQEEWIVLLNNW